MINLPYSTNPLTTITVPGTVNYNITVTAKNAAGSTRSVSRAYPLSLDYPSTVIFKPYSYINGILTVNWNKSDPRDGNSSVIDYGVQINRYGFTDTTYQTTVTSLQPLSVRFAAPSGYRYFATISPRNVALSVGYIQDIPPDQGTVHNP